MGMTGDDPSGLADPAGMRKLAAEVSLRAESVIEVTDSLAKGVAAMTFEGPAANQLRDGMRERDRRARIAAAQLQEAAISLRRAAGAAEDQRAEEEAALRRSGRSEDG